ncbi:MAG: GntR family transcriptional regulator [Pseudomonadota bacterium]
MSQIQTTVDRVFRQLQTAIVEGKIPAGSKLSEPVIAKELGVSRAPLREALRRLENSGLVKRTPNVGCRIMDLSLEHLLEIYQIRESLESMAAGLAAINMTDDEIKDLEDMLKLHRKEISANQNYFQKEGDKDFHFRIIKGSKNNKLIDMFSNDIYQLIRLYRYQFGMVSNRVEQAFCEHEQIVDAIRQRDDELASILMKRHIRRSQLNIEKMLSEQLDSSLWLKKA